MTAKEFADRIVEITLKMNGSATQGTLSARGLADHIDGDMAMTIDENRHLIGFVGVSGLFIDAVQFLLSENPRRVTIRSIDYLSYMIDGCPIPSMPLAKRIPAGGYKSDHFVPLCFDKPQEKKT